MSLLRIAACEYVIDSKLVFISCISFCNSIYVLPLKMKAFLTLFILQYFMKQLLKFKRHQFKNDEQKSK
jgi:hypothetical protein